jgi:biotin synthase
MCDTAKKALPPGIEPISGDEARRLIHHTAGAELEALLDRARAVREAVHGTAVSLCGITNAKSGRCPENCGFCQQSAHFAEADAPVYPLVSAREMAEQAKIAEASGAREFSIVCSGTRVSKESELATIEEAIRLIKRESAVEPCASLGLMHEPELRRLQAAGLEHYHHNLETAPSHFDHVCTTHTYDEQLETIRAAKKLGLKLCSGGILGMGETPEQRVEFAETLRELDVHCIPMNFLNPRPGTPMAHLRAITAEECLAAIAVYRLMMPGAHIFVMGGREVNLGDRQDLIFRAGANGTMVGNYLTSAGKTPEQVVGMVEGQGLRLRGPADGRAWAFHGAAPAETQWNQRAVEGDRRSLPIVRG